VRSELTVLRLIGGAPGVVAGEIDVFPAKRGDMPEQVVRYALTVCPQGVWGGLQIRRVPQNDGCDQEVEPRGAVDLAFEGAVP
jgi:hypothetical protein